MKKIFLLLLLALSILLVSGCSFITEKITNKIVGEVLENAAGDDADIDIDEGKVVIKDEDGSEIVIGGTEWPTGEAAQTIPIFEDGEIIYITDSVTAAMISIIDVTENEYTDYVEKLKSEGFTENSFSAENDGSFTYMAYKTDTHYVSVTFDGEGGLIISVATE